MPIITVQLFSGRTRDQKRELVESLTAETARIANCREDDVHVVIQDVGKENWGIGGQLAADLFER